MSLHCWQCDLRQQIIHCMLQYRRGPEFSCHWSRNTLWKPNTVTCDDQQRFAVSMNCLIKGKMTRNRPAAGRLYSLTAVAGLAVGGIFFARSPVPGTRSDGCSRFCSWRLKQQDNKRKSQWGEKRSSQKIQSICIDLRRSSAGHISMQLPTVGPAEDLLAARRSASKSSCIRLDQGGSNHFASH